MTPPEGCNRYREQIGAFLLGKLDGGELEAMRAHLDVCPTCRAEVGELEPVVAALADADPDRIEEDAWPPGDLEESTLAPILGEIHRARSRGRRSPWSALAAAAVCVVAIGLAGLTWFLEPAVAMEPLRFSVAPGMEDVRGGLIAHDGGVEIRLVVPEARDGQPYRVTLVSEAGKRVDAGTFVGAGDEPVRGTFNAALSREDAQRLEVRTPGGERVFIAELPEEPRDPVRDWPLLGVLPWAGPGLQNDTMEPSGPEGPEGLTQEKPKDADPGGRTPPEGSSPEGDGEKSPPPAARSLGRRRKKANPLLAHPLLAHPLLSQALLAHPLLSQALLAHPLLSQALVSYHLTSVRRHAPSTNPKCEARGERPRAPRDFSERRGPYTRRVPTLPVALIHPTT